MPQVHYCTIKRHPLGFMDSYPPCQAQGNLRDNCQDSFPVSDLPVCRCHHCAVPIFKFNYGISALFLIRKPNYFP